MGEPVVVIVETPAGPGRVTMRMPSALDAPSDAGAFPAGGGPGVGRGLLVLGHGAGGQSWSKDVLAVREAAVRAGWAVALVDQPWRVAGRRVADRPPRLDEAWPSLVASARDHAPGGVLVVGGRSAGARVACRTHEQTGADAVLCLSFPLHLPGKPQASRVSELARPVAAGVPVRVVQGARDPFGTPDEVRGELAVTLSREAADGLDLVEVPGTHTLTSPVRVASEVTTWLAALSS